MKNKKIIIADGTGFIGQAELEGSDLVVNLAGRSVNCRYTRLNRQEISNSRADTTKAIGLATKNALVPPRLWVNGGSATIYRHAEDQPQDEYTGQYEDDFPVKVCKRWEKTFEEQRTPFTLKILPRLAITLGKGGILTAGRYLQYQFTRAGHQPGIYVHATPRCPYPCPA